MALMNGKSLYRFAGPFAPFWLGSFPPDMPDIPGKGVRRNTHIEAAQALQQEPLRRANLQFGRDDFLILFQPAERRLGLGLFFLDDAAKGIGGLGVVGRHGRMVAGGGHRGNRLSDGYRINVGQTSYAKRKTMVSWQLNGEIRCGLGGGLTGGFAA